METVEQLAEELLEAVKAETTLDPGAVTMDHAADLLRIETLEEKYTKLRAAFVALAGEDYLQSNGL